MGKVLSQFRHGTPGAVSRAVDEVVISLKNGSEEEIPFGVPVFLMSGNNNCVQKFNSASVTDASRFLGFSVRAGDKTPGEYGSAEGAYSPGDPVDIRISDGRLTTAAGTAGTTILLPNVSVRGPRDGQNHMEIVVTGRNLL